MVPGGEPRVVSARYDRRTRRMIVELINGCSFIFPSRALQGMARTNDAALANVEILGQVTRCTGRCSTRTSPCPDC
jgi:hypothetical protein